MFKKIALSGLLLSLFSFPLLAQQTTTPDAQTQASTRMGRNRSMQQRPMADPATRARKMTDRLTKQLNLDQATSQKVYDATLARDQKISDIQANTDDNKAKANALKANADDYKSKLQGILTLEQYTTFQSMKGHKHPNREGNDEQKDDADQN